jgi:hypothetical protein
MAVGKESVNLIGDRQNSDRSMICGKTAPIGMRAEGEPGAGRLVREKSFRTGGLHESILSDDGRCDLKPALRERGFLRRRGAICERNITSAVVLWI